MRAVRPSAKRTAVGMPKEEARLQRSLVAALACEPLRRGLKRIICSEVDVSHGIADVVVATANGGLSAAEWLAPSSLKHLNFTTAKLLSQLRYNEYRPVTNIGKSTGFSHETVLTHLRTLEKLGLVKRKGVEARLLRSTKTPFMDVTAFEIKVADWRHGLYQATHYRSFANRVVVALPDAKAKSVAVHKGTFRQFGIGLVGINGTASMTWYVKPARRQPTSPSRVLLGFVQLLKRKEAKVLRVHGK
jgi:hypothetical protein